MSYQPLREDSIGGLRGRARRRLPRMVFDFIDGGADSELTLRSNTDELARVCLIPNCFADVQHRNPSCHILGHDTPLPLIIGPTGLAALVWPKADELLARAAQEIGVPFVISTSSSASIEDIADAAPSARLWMQIYLYKDRDLVKSLIRRAADRGCEALVLTVDTPLLGHRSRDHANRFSVPLRPTGALIWELLRCPGWTMDILRHGIPRMENLIRSSEGRRLQSLASVINQNMNPGATWGDLSWIRDAWRGKLILKGVMACADAQRAEAEGIDAIVVSNHGGRQLDCVPATVTVLPELVGAVGRRMEIYVDGGIRSGADIAKVVALGARAAMVGRATLYGVAAAGAAGASHALRLLCDQYDRTLALLGCDSSQSLSSLAVLRHSSVNG